MDQFFTWLSQNPTAANTLIISFGILVSTTVLIYTVAFFQGRSISFWFPKIGARPIKNPTPSKKKTKKERGEIENLGLPPDTYSFEYLKKVIAYRYGPETGFLVIKYGSSVTRPVSANDEDYIILVHGNFYHGEVEKEEFGPNKKPNVFLAKPIDIHIRLFDSFLIGLIMGKPYEVSIAMSGEVKDSYLMPKEYFNWLQVDADYVAERIQHDLHEHREQYVNARLSDHPFTFIIAAYHYISDILQIASLQKHPKRIPATHLYPLFQANFLKTQAESQESSLLYEKLIDYFKRNRVPPNTREFEQQINRLLILLQGESGNV